MGYALIDVTQQFQFEVLKQLVEKSNCDIKFVTTTNKGHFRGDEQRCLSLLDEIKKTNNSVVHEGLDFLNGDSFISKINSIPWVLTSNHIIELKEIESLCMRLMDRVSLKSISAFSRRRYYLILLNYFSYIIEKEKITDVIVFDIPHTFYSYVFYQLCKKKKLNTIVLEHHYLTGYSAIHNQFSFPEIPKDYLPEISLPKLEEKIPTDINEVLFKSSPFLVASKIKETKAIVKSGKFSTLKLIIRYFDKATKNFIMGCFPFFFKKEVLHFTALDNIKNRFIYRNLLNIKLIKLIRLNIQYNKICEKNPNLNCNYVFLALHMQPEKTSQPMGLEFDNQFMMVKVISQSMPKGWKLFVKEHPNQFNVRKVPNRHYRDSIFYKALSQIENVKFIPLEKDSRQLVIKSKMIATLTGTVGWEAITAFKPALVFGESYYMNCGSVRKVTSVNSCKKAIDELLSLSKEDMKSEIYRYLSYYLDNKFLVKAGRWETELISNELSYNEQVDNIADRMFYFHKLNNINN